MCSLAKPSVCVRAVWLTLYCEEFTRLSHRVNKLITNNNACKIMIGTSVGLLLSFFFLRKIGIVGSDFLFSLFLTAASSFQNRILRVYVLYVRTHKYEY